LRRILKIGTKKTHKCLCIGLSHDIGYKNERAKLKKEYFKRVRLVFGTELSANSNIQVIGSMAVPVQ
jgi:hypothetical protein